ncbi:MAG TPA: response regulator [Desulfatiglandales bacterium]|nr:response regulator [Desulfatiglandales bacterium]
MAKSILIIDDDEMVCMALTELLKPEGYEIDTVWNAKEALERIDKKRYNLLILDIIMPGMNGLELCKKIKAREDYNEIPVVFLTAKNREEDRMLGIEAGAKLFLSKPISPDKLLKIVSETLG